MSARLLLSRTRVATSLATPRCLPTVAQRASKYTKVLAPEAAKMNPHLLSAQYAVRGAIPQRADEIASLLSKPNSFNFKNITYCNIGNPQSLAQKPLTFVRQVLSLLDYPDLITDPAKLAVTKTLFPADAIERAQLYFSKIGSTGAYSHSKGVQVVREEVAEFIYQRDKPAGVDNEATRKLYKPDTEEIFLTDGASVGVAHLLSALINSPKAGIMIPIPQYPLYSATIALCDGQVVPYYLDEANDWDLTVAELNDSLAKAKSQGLDVKALAVINPGNPTGQTLSIESMQEIAKFCHANSIVLLADEVYQTNVYYPEKRPFHSFKKVVKSIPSIANELELVSFHSVSKGVIGECGRRGGYMELTNIDAGAIEQIYKKASISLCSNIPGQITVGLMVNPPKPGSPSFESHQAEQKTLFDALKRRAEKLVASLSQLEGVTCNTAQGAMYVFPQIRLPVKAVEAAKAAGVAPDAFYCMQLLEATGVCTVPGSGFKQRDGTHHFRATFLPPESQFDVFLAHFTDFHKKFIAKYQ